MSTTGVSRRDRRVVDDIELRAFDGLEAARVTWAALSVTSTNIFSSWEWADTWWRHRGGQGELALVAVVRDGQTVALLPAYRTRRGGINVLRFLGHGAADQLEPIMATGEAEAASAGLRLYLRRHGGTALVERMPGNGPWAAVAGGRSVRAESSPTIDIAQEGDWNEYLGRRSANFRQQVRRRERRLSALGVTYRLAGDPAHLARDLNTLMRLHDLRWGTTSQAFRGREAFHHAFASRALEAGWLRLWLAEAEGTPVAAWYGFRYAGVESYYQAGRDPSWDRHGIGAGLLEHTIREAFVDGMAEYRLLRGDEPYKRRYETYDSGVQTVLIAARPLTCAATMLASRLARSPRALRLLKPLASDG